MDELEQLLNGEALEPTPSSQKEVEKQPNEEQIKTDNEAKAKAEQLENLNKAIAEAQGKLKDLRKAKKTQPVEEEEIPKINMDDPSAKAWDKHIRENVNPIQAELDAEKSEVRNFALKEFLSDKPALARNPDKIKELMENYERLRTASERTREGVLLDLEKSYAATFSNELLNAARSYRTNEVRNDILFSDAAVSRGSTAYSAPKEQPVRLSDEERLILAKWGMTPEEWIADKKAADQKAAQ